MLIQLTHEEVKAYQLKVQQWALERSKAISEILSEGLRSNMAAIEPKDVLLARVETWDKIHPFPKLLPPI